MGRTWPAPFRAGSASVARIARLASIHNLISLHVGWGRSVSKQARRSTRGAPARLNCSNQSFSAEGALEPRRITNSLQPKRSEAEDQSLQAHRSRSMQV